MVQKRVADFVSHGVPEHHQKKHKKAGPKHGTERHGHGHGRTPKPAGNGPTSKLGESSFAKEKIELLAQLTFEILHDPKGVEQCGAIAGEDVAVAVSNLGRLLQTKKGLVSSLSEPSRIDGQTHLPMVPSVSTYFEQNPYSLPNLPPILDPLLAEIPFIHKASLQVGGKPPGANNAHYERLEFLGDAYIELIASRLIYQQYPGIAAGHSSQLREVLVKNETLKEYALAYNFDERAKLSQVYTEPGVQRKKLWTKVLGDIFEAYVAAVVVSDPTNGFVTAEKWLTTLWRPKLPDQSINIPENTLAKQDLARKVMGSNVQIEYENEGAGKQDHHGIKRQYYNIGVYLTGWGWTHEHLGSGVGKSISDAGMRAASQALQNPLTAQIAAVKREYDEKAERERSQNQ